MIYLLYGVHVLLCFFLILVVLLQQGKGADLAVFGGGATMTAFGARSATTLLHRLTVAAFVGFVVTTLGIAYIKGQVESRSLMQGAAAKPVSAPAEAAAPGGPAAALPAPAATAPAADAATSGAPVPEPANP